jgi:hypothetical protein
VLNAILDVDISLKVAELVLNAVLDVDNSLKIAELVLNAILDVDNSLKTAELVLNAILDVDISLKIAELILNAILVWRSCHLSSLQTSDSYRPHKQLKLILAVLVLSFCRCNVVKLIRHFLGPFSAINSNSVRERKIV